MTVGCWQQICLSTWAVDLFLLFFRENVSHVVTDTSDKAPNSTFFFLFLLTLALCLMLATSNVLRSRSLRREEEGTWCTPCKFNRKMARIVRTCFYNVKKKPKAALHRFFLCVSTCKLVGKRPELLFTLTSANTTTRCDGNCFAAIFFTNPLVK